MELYGYMEMASEGIPSCLMRLIVSKYAVVLHSHAPRLVGSPCFVVLEGTELAFDLLMTRQEVLGFWGWESHGIVVSQRNPISHRSVACYLMG